MMSNWGSSVDEPKKKTQEFYNLRHFIHSKKRLRLQRSVTFKKVWDFKGFGGRSIGNLSVPLEKSWLGPWLSKKIPRQLDVWQKQEVG